MLTTTPICVRCNRPPYGERDELHVLLPCGHACALIPEVHAWRRVDLSWPPGLLGGYTVSPSIVCPQGDYHGWLRAGRWC